MISPNPTPMILKVTSSDTIHMTDFDIEPPVHSDTNQSLSASGNLNMINMVELPTTYPAPQRRNAKEHYRLASDPDITPPKYAQGEGHTVIEPLSLAVCLFVNKLYVEIVNAWPRENSEDNLKTSHKLALVNAYALYETLFKFKIEEEVRKKENLMV